MAKPGLQNISTTNTFQTWLDRTNEIVDIIKDEVVTASVIGDVTGSTGVPLTATLIGSFTANTITASTTLRADSILPRIGSPDVAIGAPIRVNASTQVGITLTNSSGPRTVFNSGSVEWRVGFEDIITNNFIIDTGLGTRKVSITPFGNVNIPGRLTAQGGVTAEVTGNSSSATVLQNARTIGITGDVVWTSPSFNGSADITAASEIQPNSVSNAKLRDSTALSVIGRSTNTLGDPGDISANTDHQVLRRSGTGIGFGTVALNQTAAVSGILPVTNGGTGAENFTAGSILFGAGSNPVSTNANLFWSNTNNRLGINQPNPEFAVDVTGDIRATGLFRGTATTAQYGDLAEKYLADREYEPGTVVCVGGEKEITASQFDDKPIGVVSTQPGLMMNSELSGGTYVALKGRVPVKVIEDVNKGDWLIPSSTPGAAKKGEKTSFNAFAVALSDSEGGVVEAIVL